MSFGSQDATMAEAAALIAQVTEPGDPDTVRVDINADPYLWEPSSNLGTKGRRRTLLEAESVDGATVAARSKPMMSARLVVQIVPQANVADLVTAYENLQEALDSPCSLTIVLQGMDEDDPIYIDLDSYDEFPNLVSGQLPWVPGCESRWFADTLVIPVLRHPESYGFSTAF